MRFPEDIIEKEIWASHLAIKDVKSVKNHDRVSVIHFFEVDYILSEGDSKSLVFNSISRSEVTKYQISNTGSSSLTAPPRPAATSKDVKESALYNRENIKYIDYIEQRKALKIAAASGGSTRKIRTPCPPTGASICPVNIKFGRPMEKPYYESFMGTSSMIMDLIRAVHEHSQQCGGQLHTRRSHVRLKRLSLNITITCAKGVDCSRWKSGKFTWMSCGVLAIPNTNRIVPTNDVLYASATYSTPTTKSHAEQFMSCLLLTPPNRNLLNDLVKVFVAPYLLSEKERLVDLRCLELKNLNQGLIMNMDVGYTGARKAQCATILVGSGSRVVFSRTDTENSAWLKEGHLISLALNEAINERKLDVVAIEIDDNASNKKKIEAFKRVNGPDHYKEESVKALNDVFHAAKSMGRQAVKFVSTYVSAMDQQLKILLPCIEFSGDGEILEMFLVKIQSYLQRNFVEHFKDISIAFDKSGATDWIETSSSSESMLHFAKEKNLVDDVIDFNFWSPVVDAWNSSIPAASARADNVGAI